MRREWVNSEQLEYPSFLKALKQKHFAELNFLYCAMQPQVLRNNFLISVIA
jgi:hypothetical protein